MCLRTGKEASVAEAGARGKAEGWQQWGQSMGCFEGALVGTGALTLSEMGALWDFQQMSLKAIDLSCESITLASVLRTDCRGLAVMQRGHRRLCSLKGEQWGWDRGGGIEDGVGFGICFENRSERTS